MKKKKIVSIIFVSFVLIATAIITSCSSEFEDELIDISSVQQRERIEQLAKEYGLSIEIRDDFFATRSGSDQDIENELAMMASLLGEYEFIGIEKGNRVEFYSINTNLLRGAKEAEVGVEEIWSDTGGNSSLFVTVTLIRYEQTGNYSIEVTAQDNSYTTLSTSQHNTYCEHVEPFFYFGSDVTINSISGAIIGYFSVSGIYNEITKSGSFSVIIPW